MYLMTVLKPSVFGKNYC